MRPEGPDAAGSPRIGHGWPGRPVRKAAISAIAAGVALAVACSSSPGATPTETTLTGAGAPPGAATQAAAISTEAYRALVSRVNIVTLDGTRLLNQIALFIVPNDDARPQLEEDVRLILGSFELQRDMLRQAEPVPGVMEEVHALLLTAMERYIEAASLLLPQSSGGPERFDFFAFQPLMEEGGKNFHGAGAALP